MRRLRSAFLGLALAGACRALPSEIPLADTGEGRASEDGALSRNRVPRAERTASATETDGSDDADDTITIVAGAADAGDAGAPEAGTAAADAGDAGTRWAGEYYGSDRHVRRISGRPEQVELDDKAHTRVEEPKPGTAIVSLVSSASGEVICGLRTRITDDRAELEPGVFCEPLDLRAPLKVTGSAKLSGDELVVDLEAHGEFPLENDTLDVDVEYHFRGKRR